MLNPLILFAGQLLVTILVLGLSARRSAIRIATIPVLTVCCALIVPRCMQFVHRSSWAALVGGYSTTFLLQYIAAVISHRQDPLGECSSDEPNGYRPAKGVERISKEAKTSLWKCATSGLEATFSCRWSGTPREVRNVPLFSNQDQSYEPTRAAFLRNHIFLLVSCYLMLDVLSLGADPDKNKIFFAPAMIPFFTRLDQVSVEELAMRIFGTLGSGLGVFCSQQGIYSIVAIIAVGFGLSEPRYWRPLFGSVGDAYTVRRFWRYVALSLMWYLNADWSTALQSSMASKQPRKDIGARTVLCPGCINSAQRVLFWSPSVLLPCLPSIGLFARHHRPCCRDTLARIWSHKILLHAGAGYLD